MKTASKAFISATALFLTVSALGYFFWYQTKFSDATRNNAYIAVKSADKGETLLRLNKKAIPAKDFIAIHGFNDSHCFLVDMKLPSGKNRFFVYNLNKDSVEIAGLVTHGSGIKQDTDALVFSNTPNSYCTSLGKYKIGKSYQGKFGLAYRLYGLDTSNSRAFNRFVVLHAHECVPGSEVFPLPICESWGCPTVSPALLIRLKKYIDVSSKPILLWIFY